MTGAVKPIPDPFTPVTPYIVVDGVDAAIAFYKKAFGAEERFRLPAPDGSRIMHAEITIAGAVIMLTDVCPDSGAKSPKALGGWAGAIHLYVPDADATFAQALAAGATEAMPLTDMFWGDRFGKVLDPFGHQWSIATHRTDPTPEEIQEGMKKAFSEAPG